MELSDRPCPWDGPERARGYCLFRSIEHQSVVDHPDPAANLVEGMAGQRPPWSPRLQEVEGGPGVDRDSSVSKPGDGPSELIAELGPRGWMDNQVGAESAIQTIVGKVDGVFQVGIRVVTGQTRCHERRTEELLSEGSVPLFVAEAIEVGTW